MKNKKTNNTKSDALWATAQRVLLGGVSLLSKKPERFLREGWPAYFKKAKGIEVTDLDGNRRFDFTYMGVGPNLLGYADRDVDKAVKEVIATGTQSTLNSPEEVLLAQELLKLHPWAGQVRYARTGGEIAAIAVRIARAHTGKSGIALCGYHGWHDWYLAANLSENKNLDGHLLPGLLPLGVPRELQGSVHTFRYNHLEDLEAVLKSSDDIGVIIMEPMRHQEPAEGFLEGVRRIADQSKAVFIFDEISSGFRLGFPGAHTRFNIAPDIVLYSKAMSNGYPMAALVGKKEVLREAEASFISSTYHSERIGPAAALATIQKMQKLRVTEYVDRMGYKIGAVWESAARKHRLPIVVEGPGAFIQFTFNHPEANVLKAIYTQQMLVQGYLATATVYVSYAHKTKHLRAFGKAVDEVFRCIAERIERGDARTFLRGGLPETGFARLT
ncbi:MAG: Glutamate-semialdehyde -aminomutase [Candidatus Parcubacteria bacterium]|jgi:glutamate-1-semialdehyde aminotransferase